MTGKQKAMIIERLKDTKASNWEIIKRSGYLKDRDYSHTSTKNAAAQQYLENMRNPEIASKLDNVVDEMEDTLITTVRKFRNSDDVREVSLASDNAKWIHDKVHGKATQRVESHNTSVRLSLDLTDITD